MLPYILKTYTSAFPEETKRQSQFEVVVKKENQGSLLSRGNMAGHVTASGILIWRSKSKVLLVRHTGLGDFYQPGGHFEQGGETPLQVAKRHIAKALPNSSLQHFQTHLDPAVPIDIDTHYIPACGELNEGRHVHYDLKYLFFLDEPAELNDSEGADRRWENITELLRRKTFEDLVPKILKVLTEVQTRLFFADVCNPLRAFTDVSCVAVAHFIPDVFPYLDAVKQAFDVLGIVPKPRSIVPEVEIRLRQSFNIWPLSRESINAHTPFLDFLGEPKNRFLLLDIGGYFSEIANELASRFGDRFVGIVEDTENGHQKYENVAKREPLRVPVISVARSPLKENEDFLVGQSILFSTDFVLREFGQLVQYLQCGVFGYGKIGSSIAHHLLLRGVKPWVFDSNAIKRARALNQLCNTPPQSYIVKNADVIFSATGNKALNIVNFRNLKSGCFVVSVTSADDELDLSLLSGEYKAEKINTHLTKYSSFANYFYLVNEGNAVNFIHNAVLGDWIHLVRGEMLHAAAHLLKQSLKPGIRELPEDERKCVVEKWLKVFVDERRDYKRY